MKMHKEQVLAITVLAAMTLAASEALAQEVVGRSAVKGRPVELLDDGTWRFTEAASSGSGCDVLSHSVTFCGPGDGWMHFPPPGPMIEAAYALDDRNYGQFIFEDVGSQDGLDHESYRSAVLTYVAAAIGQPGQAIPVLDVIEQELDGQMIETTVFSTDSSGPTIVFMNSILVTPTWSAQFITWNIGPDYDSVDLDLHETFLGLIEVPR